MSRMREVLISHDVENAVEGGGSLRRHLLYFKLI